MLCLREQQWRWFDLRADQELRADDGGVYRIRSFPGLWIHGEALMDGDYERLMKIVQEGLGTREHAAFVEQLAAKRISGRE